MTQPDSSLPPQTAAPEADARYDWITNEGLLRDEGVLFGLAHAASGPQADAMLAAKLESIEAAFALRKARAAQDRAKAQARLDALEERRDELVAMRDAGRSGPDDADPWPRHMLGVAIAGGAAVLSYGIVAELLAPAGFGSPVLVATATVAAGLSGQFATVSTLFTSDGSHLEKEGAAELWKVRLTEFALPVVAALFAVSWGAASRPVALSAVSFLQLSLVFLVASRLALSAISPLWASLRLGRVRRLAALAADDQKLRDERVRLQVALHDCETDAALDAQCAGRRALLLSEVALARSARATFGDAMADDVRSRRPDGAGGVSGDGAAGAAPREPEVDDGEPDAGDGAPEAA